jgi:hypothetical protein
MDRKAELIEFVKSLPVSSQLTIVMFLMDPAYQAVLKMDREEQYNKGLIRGVEITFDALTRIKEDG